MDSTVNIESENVIKIILQYLKENGLTRSLLMLQEESGVSLNSVANVDALASHVQNGRWNQVLDALDTMSLSQETLFVLYDQIVRELVDLKETKLAMSLLQNAIPLLEMRKHQPEQYNRLSDLCAKRPQNSKEIYAGLASLGSQQQHLTKEKRRLLVADALKAEIESVPQSRLLAIIGMALKWQHHMGIIPNVDQFDVFKNTSASAQRESDFRICKASKSIKLADGCHAECAVFTPNGQHLITGSSDGFIEVWNWSLGALDMELEYQKNDKFMLHDTLVVSLAVSKDSEILASGSKDGQIKFWRLSTGECLRIINGAHEEAIVTITFSRDCTHILTGSFDTTARIHGLKSGNTLKHFRGHSSIVNSALYSNDGTRVITGSSDGLIKIWDAKTTECLRSFPAAVHEPKVGVKSAIPINKVLLLSNAHGTEATLVACMQSATCNVVDSKGQVLKPFKLEADGEDKDFIDVSVSPHCEWVYCLAQNNNLYIFNFKTGKCESILKTHETEAIGVLHHPAQSILTTWSLDGTINLFYP